MGLSDGKVLPNPQRPEPSINSCPSNDLGVACLQMVIDISMRYCGPCKVVYPFVAELSNQLPDVRFYHLCGDQVRNAKRSTN